MTISRRQWRGIETGAASVEERSAFGWVVHRHVLPPGAAMVIVASSDVERAKAPNRAIYVRGRASVTRDDGAQFPDRVPGLFTGDRPDHPGGIVTVRAVEETEFWCFNWHANRGALPDLTPLRFPDGGHLVSRAGDRILVCSGQIGPHGAGAAFVADESWPPVLPGTYALVIGGERV